MANQGSAASVTHSLRGIDFPAKLQDLIEHAQKNGAEKEVIEALRNLPDREYETMADVMQGFGEERSS